MIDMQYIVNRWSKILEKNERELFILMEIDFFLINL
jgi:hypothetical protein